MIDKFFENLLLKKGVWRVFRHLLFWILMYLDELIFTFTDEAGFTDLDYVVVPLFLDVITVYINLYVLIPLFFRKKNYLLYISLTMLTVVVNVLPMMIYLYYGSGQMPYIEDFAASLIGTATLLATAIAIKLGKFSFEQRKLTDQLKLDQSVLELNYLKQQINPHFLFNVLNTINIQSVSNPSSVSSTVLQLSDMLRYQIYDAGQSETVPIIKEIDFLKNYSSLEQLRRDNLKLSWRQDDHIPKLRITPFLFLPLVENAFKHSRSLTNEPSFVDIAWTYHEEAVICTVKNSIGDVRNEEGGFGIDNLKKRLEILYPDHYSLDLHVKGGVHISCLSIRIHEGNNH